MRKTFRYRAYANKQTVANMEKWLELCRYLYNSALEQRIAIYRQDKGCISLYDQMKQIKDIRVTFPEYSDVNVQMLREVLIRLDNAYKAFFRRISSGEKVGFPRFKGKGRFDSLTFQHNGWCLDSKYLFITNVGRFKLRLSRPIQGTIKTVTLSRSLSGEWYACFSCDKVPEKTLPESDKSIGLDVGIKSFLVDSDGNEVANPRHYRMSQANLRRKQRRLARRVKGSQGRIKARILVAKSQEKVQNQRRDFLHKTATYYIQNYGMIAVETLNIKGMVRNHKLARSILDAAWGEFFGLLSYKAEEAGRELIKVPRFEPTSKTCSVCGEVKKNLTLSDRRWVCQSCGTLHDRDYNAAKNILRVGQTLQAQTCGSSQSVACESRSN